MVALRAKAGNKGNHVVKELTLNIEDKFECIKLGDLLDISQQVNNFSVKDKGGSLPIGMSVDESVQEEEDESYMHDKEGWVVVEKKGRGGQDREETTKSNP